MYGQLQGWPEERELTKTNVGAAEDLSPSGRSRCEGRQEFCHVSIENQQWTRGEEMIDRLSEVVCNKLIIALFAVATCILPLGGSTARGAEDEILKNETILELHQMDFSEQIIIGKIKNTLSDFDVDLESLKALKEAGLPDSIVAAMIEASSSEQAVSTDFDPNDPLSPHSPGIYLYVEGGDGGSTLTKMEPSSYTQSKSGGYLKSAFTYGAAKVKSRASLPGLEARVKTGSQPTFYFHFEETESGLSYQSQATTNPGEFVLAEFTVKRKKGKEARELVVGQFSAYGAQSGALDKTIQLFDFEKVAPGIFKVVPREPLSTGEYCFYYAGATPLPTYGYYAAGAGGGGGKVFDFSVKAR